MTRPLILVALLLAGCGTDGPPFRPGTDEPVTLKPGLSIGGTAEFGIRSN